MTSPDRCGGEVHSTMGGRANGRIDDVAPPEEITNSSPWDPSIHPASPVPWLSDPNSNLHRRPAA